MTTKQRGRPKSDHSKHARIHIRATNEQLERYRRAANAQGKSVSEWIRAILNAAS